MTDEDHLISPTQAAEMTTLSTATICRLTQLGRFPKPIHITPRRLAYWRNDVMKWVRDREVHGPVSQEA